MKKALMIVGLTVGGIAAVGGSTYAVNQAFTQTKTENRTVAQDVRAVEIRTGAGDVDLVRGGDRVQVRETRHYVVRRPKVTYEIENGVLKIESTCPGGFLLDCTTDFRVEIPSGVPVAVNTDTGDVSADALESSEVHVYTDVGDVQLDLAGSTRLVDARTDVGDLDIAVPAGTWAVDEDTDVGDSDVEGLVQDERAARSIKASTDVGDLLVHAR